MKVGDIVRKRVRKIKSISQPGVIIEHKSMVLYNTQSTGKWGIDVEIAKARHAHHGDHWGILWGNGNFELCWGADLEVINE